MFVALLFVFKSKNLLPGNEQMICLYKSALKPPRHFIWKIHNVQIYFSETFLPLMWNWTFLAAGKHRGLCAMD